jgi:hypothetical protein
MRKKKEDDFNFHSKNKTLNFLKSRTFQHEKPTQRKEK